MRFLDYIFFARPLLLVPVWTVYFHYLSFLSGGKGVSVGIDTVNLMKLGALTLIFGGVYVLNQIFDIESDRVNDKLYFLPRGMISVKAAWIYYAVLTAAGLVIAGLSESDAIYPAQGIVLLGVLYSVPVIKLKDRPMQALIANGWAYGVMVPIMVSPNSMPQLSGLTGYLLAIATGYILTTIPDRDGDLATGKRTIAVICGVKGALWWGLTLSSLACAAALIAHNYELAGVSGVTVLLVGYLLVSYSRSALMLACKLPILLLTIAAGVHFPLYLMVLLLTIILTRLYYHMRFGIIYPKLG
jgi:4-hydroxybenzoate polyprenyltransferase